MKNADTLKISISLSQDEKVALAKAIQSAISIQSYQDAQSLSTSAVKGLSKRLASASGPYLQIFLRNHRAYVRLLGNKKIAEGQSQENLQETVLEQVQKMLDLDSNDISALRRYLAIRHFKKRDAENFHEISKVKARFYIWALTAEGFYEQPDVDSPDALYYAVYRKVFDSKNLLRLAASSNAGSDDDKRIEVQTGCYLLYRLSFNNTFAGQITCSRLWIWQDEGSEIFRYATLNSYNQRSLGGVNLQRTRETSGYLFYYQGNLLFFGSVDYSHMDQAHRDSSKLSNHYPEIILAHRHGGDTKNIRGLILGHYPFLRLPVSTRVYLSFVEKSERVSPEKMEALSASIRRMNWPSPDDYRQIPYDQYLSLFKLAVGKLNGLALDKSAPRDDSDGACVFDKALGLRDPHDPANASSKKGELASIKSIYDKFLKNQIEGTYSQMLTP